MVYDSIEDTIIRINKMEIIFDILQDNVNFKNEELYKKLYNQLIDYYESDWKEDYLLDELGLLPSNLKRGILSEDGIYNFISLIEND